MKKVALIYDFDETLSPKNMFEFDVLPELGYVDTSLFWQKVFQVAQTKKMDSISAYLYLLKEEFKQKKILLTHEKLNDYGRRVNLCKGVETWFKRTKEYAKKLNLELEHYIISSGLKEIIEGLPIAKYLTQVYACSFLYDQQGVAIWPAQIVNYTTKTQYIFRINKQILSESNGDINDYVPLDERPIPFSRMMYIGDGFTDIPCMRLIKEYKGKAIVVYHKEQQQPKLVGEKLLRDGRASILVPADYREDSPIEQYVKQNLHFIHEKILRKELEKKIW